MGFSRFQLPIRLLVCLLLLAACWNAPLFAQSANISGQVLDASGAGVKGGAITLLSVDKQTTLNTVTDGRGAFIFPPVAPGHYRISINAAGYEPWSESSIEVEIGQAKQINAVLTVGSVNQSVVVMDTAPEINTETADRGTVTESSLVENIPLDVRNPLQETNFAVGVTQSNVLDAGTNATSQEDTNLFYVNGTKEGESEILIDGAADTTFYDLHAAGAIPGLDAVQEFRIYTNPYAPEFGHTAGGISSYSIKSGTNAFHGGAWEYYRSDVMDANGYNANAAGEAKPSFERNQFGAQIGGPVIVPKLYNGHDKTFFFGSYEELRDSSPGAGLTTTVPTALERTGDFSSTLNSNGTMVPLYDPSTTALYAANSTYSCADGKTYSTTSAGYYRCPLYYNGRYNVIDPSRLNPIAQALLNSYPVPNKAGVGGSDENNFFSDAPAGDHDYNYDIRVDHKINDKHSIYGHIDFFDNFILYAPVFGQPSLTPNNGNDWIPGRNIMVDHTWSITPRLIYDHHLSWAHMESHRSSVDPLGTAPFGIPGSAAPGITATFTPQVEATTNQLGELGNSEPYERNPASVWQYAGAFVWLKGIHTLKFGVDLRRYPVQLYDPQLLTINTSRTFTGGPYANAPGGTTGDAIAELLLGQATVTSGYAPRVNTRHQYYAGYAEDTVKATRKLTVTYGVRYSLEGGDVSSGNELTYLDTTDPSAIATQVPSLPNLVGGVGVVGLNGSSRELQIPGKLHFAPRLGISYSVNDKTVVHAGAGIFYHPTATWLGYPSAYGYTRESTSIDAAANGYQPLYSLSNPFPNGLPAPYGNNPQAAAGNNTGSGPMSIELGQSIAGNPRKQSDAYQESWSLDVQRMLPQHFVVTAAYVGNAGVHLLGEIDDNQLTDAQLAQGSAVTDTVANPFSGIITDSSSVLSKSTVQAGYLMHPHPQFTGFQLQNTGWGHSSYEAGQFTVEHRMNQGLSMMLAYTYSKSIDDVGEYGTSATIQDDGCLRCERSVADLDQTNVLRLSWIYELPFGPGNAWLNHGFTGVLAGGWQVGGTYQYNTGQPLQLTSPQLLSSSLEGNAVMRPTLVPGENIKTKVTNGSGEQSSFNPAAFKETGEFAFGNVPRYLSDARYPSYSDFDVLIEKKTHITERTSFTLRFEAMNAFNTVVFGTPDVGVNDTNFGYNPHVQSNTPRIAQLSGRFTF